MRSPASISDTRAKSMVEAYFYSLMYLALMRRRVHMLSDVHEEIFKEVEFWYSILRVMDRVATDDYHQIRRYFKNIFPSTFKDLHKTLMSDYVDWDMVYDGTRVISLRLDMRQDHSNFLRATCSYWDSVSMDDQDDAIDLCLKQIRSVDPNSTIAGGSPAQVATSTAFEAALRGSQPIGEKVESSKPTVSTRKKKTSQSSFDSDSSNKSIIEYLQNNKYDENLKDIVVDRVRGVVVVFATIMLGFLIFYAYRLVAGDDLIKVVIAAIATELVFGLMLSAVIAYRAKQFKIPKEALAKICKFEKVTLDEMKGQK